MLADVLDQILQVHDSEDVIDVLLEDRHPRVALFEQAFEQGRGLRGDRESEDLGARDHDLLDGHLGRAGGGADDREGRSDRGALPGAPRQAQDRFRRRLGIGVRAAADPANDRLDDPIEEKVQGAQELVEDVDRKRHQEGDPARVTGGGGLGEDLAEDQHQKRHHRGGDGDPLGLPQVGDRQARRRCGAEDVDQVVAEQDRHQQVRGVPEEIPDGEGRWAAKLSHFFLDLVAPEAQQRRLASREEGGEHEACEYHE